MSSAPDTPPTVDDALACATAAAQPRPLPDPREAFLHQATPRQVYFPRRTARKPVGGYIRLMVVQLCLIWWLYRSKQIRLLDLRVWFACHELEEQCRCGLPRDQLTVDAIRKVLRWQGGHHHLEQSIRRLEARGLMTWSASKLRFATSPTDLQGSTDLTGYHAMLQRIEKNTSRCVPVPRQHVRVIAQGCGKIQLATLLGHLLRCLYYRDGQCVSRGRCKASWIATVFGVDREQVKRERRRLLAIKLLESGPPLPQWQLNCHGPVIYVSLTWTQAGLREAGTRCAEATPLPPPSGRSRDGIAPPSLNQKLFSDLKHQQSAPAAETGVHIPQRSNPKTTAPTPPTMLRMSLEDLKDPHRTALLYEDACTRGWIGRSDHERREFFAMDEHVLTHAKVNPMGMLSANIRHGRWYVITNADEDAASRRFGTYWHGHETPHRSYDDGIDPQCRTQPPPASALPDLSKDVWCVRALQRECARQGVHIDVFQVLEQFHEEDPVHWTQEYCQIIASELDHSPHARKQASGLHRLGACDSVEDWPVSLSPEGRECPECGEDRSACNCQGGDEGED